MRAAGISFDTFAPNIDETPQIGENGAALAQRLAREKCAAGSNRYTEAVIIGSDQVGVVNDHILAKPGDAEANMVALRRCQGCVGHFYTALCVADPSKNAMYETHVVTTLKFRRLSQLQIEQYVSIDRPWDCAGGFKIEAAGIGLFEYVRSDDPTALQGLPMIAVIDALERSGVKVW